jgi:hypothetical protein
MDVSMVLASDPNQILLKAKFLERKDFLISRDTEDHEGVIRSSYSESAERWALCRIVISQCPFLHGKMAMKEVVVYLNQLSPEVLERAIKKEYDRAFAHWKLLPDQVGFGQKVFDSLIQQLPRLSLGSGLWMIDEESSEAEYLETFIKYGLTVVPGPDYDKTYSRSTLFKTRLAKVVRADEARLLGLPGELLPQPLWVFWPEASRLVAEVPIRQQAERLMLELMCFIHLNSQDELVKSGNQKVRKAESEGLCYLLSSSYRPAQGEARFIERSSWRKVLDGESCSSVQKWIVEQERIFSFLTEEERRYLLGLAQSLARSLGVKY